jgi:MOSC domain-containing protein YiiM
MSPQGRVVSVNVGTPRPIRWLGQQAMTAIWKSPVEGRVGLRGVNLDGDDQADRSAHGGPDKAVYAYAQEDAQWWEMQLGRSIDPGGFGENLTLAGVDLTGALIGERWQIGGAIIEVAQPRFPCWKLGARMNDSDFPQRFAEAGRPGAYLRVITEGDVGARDEVFLLRRPAHGVTIGTVCDIYLRDRARASLLLAVPALAEGLKRWAGRHAHPGGSGRR